MHAATRQLCSLTVLFLSLFLVACGGSGGGDDGSSETLITLSDGSATITWDGQTATFTLDATNANGTVSYSVTGDPAFGSVTISGNTLTYTPAGEHTGDFVVEVTAADSLGSVAATFSITVVDKLSLYNYSGRCYRETATEVPYITYGGYGARTYSVLTAPSHGTASFSAGTLTYTPATDWVGSDSFVVQISDGSNTTQATMTMTTIPPVEDVTVNAVRGDEIHIAIASSNLLGQPITYTISDVVGDARFELREDSLRAVTAWGYTGTSTCTLNASTGETASITVNVSHASDTEPYLVSAQTTLNAAGTFIQRNSTASTYRLSRDGKWIVFLAYGDNIAGPDTLAENDTFLYEVATGTLTNISTDIDGVLLDRGDRSAVINADGSTIYLITSKNLDHGTSTEPYHAFAYDRSSGSLSRLSLSGMTNTTQVLACSADGRYLVILSYSNLLDETNNYAFPDLYRFDTQTNALIRVSRYPDETAASNVSGSYYGLGASISDDGDIICFQSTLPHTATDTGTLNDLFTYQVSTGITTCVSLDADGNGEAAVYAESNMDASGRYIVFSSEHNNIVSGDNDNEYDVFLHDRQSGITSLITTGSTAECISPFITADAARIAFTTRDLSYNTVGHSVAANYFPVIYDVAGDSFSNFDVLPGNRSITAPYTSWESIYMPQLSSDGTVVAFRTTAYNLVANDLNWSDDVFVLDLSAATPNPQAATRMVDGYTALSNLRVNDPHASSDGRFVVYSGTTEAEYYDGWYQQRDRLYWHDCQTGITLVVNDVAGEVADGSFADPHVSDDGNTVLFLAKTAELAGGTYTTSWELYRATKTGDAFAIERVALNGASACDAIEFDMTPDASVGVVRAQQELTVGAGAGQLYRVDLTTDVPTLISINASDVVANGTCNYPRISGDGQVIVYLSQATNLTAETGTGGRNVFRYDHGSGSTTMINAGSSGAGLSAVAIDGDGDRIVFTGDAKGLDADNLDTDSSTDCYLWDAVDGITRLHGASTTGRMSASPAISADGAQVVFASNRSDMGVDGLNTNHMRVFAYDVANAVLTFSDLVPVSGWVAWTDELQVIGDSTAGYRILSSTVVSSSPNDYDWRWESRRSQAWLYDLVQATSN